MELKNDTIRVIEHESVILRMRSDNIVHVSFKPNTEITVDFQLTLLGLYNEITDGEKHKFIFDGGEFVSITSEAREYAVQIEDDSPTIASAIVVRNLAQKIIADFYYRFNKPKQPYKVFWSHDKAISWLKEL